MYAQHLPLLCTYQLRGLPAAHAKGESWLILQTTTWLLAILILTGEEGCFLSTAAKSTSLYSFSGWLSPCCLILLSVQKWKSIGFVTWPTVLFTGCPREERACKFWKRFRVGSGEDFGEKRHLFLITRAVSGELIYNILRHDKIKYFQAVYWQIYIRRAHLLQQ